MFQAAGRVSKALQLQALPRLLSRSSTFALPNMQLPSITSTYSFSQSATALDLPTSAKDYTEQQIAEIRQRVFGTHIGNGLPSGRKILRKKLMGEKIAAYYAHGEPLKDPLIVNLDAERYKLFPRILSAWSVNHVPVLCSASHGHLWTCRRGVQLAALKRRGKGPPKKGQGKRAGKKKR